MARIGGGKLLVVAQDGKGHFSNVQAAIDAVPLRNNERITIDVWPGVYRQPIYVPKTKNKITLRGFCAEDTVLTWNNTATRIEHHQVEEEKLQVHLGKRRGFCSYVQDVFKSSRGGENTSSTFQDKAASVIGTGTFGCGTVIVEGEDFIAEGITFENAAPEGSGQAVAIRVTADRCAFYSCRFLGWQDTAYLHYGKHYLRDCYIEGSCDFIFGNATALLEHCHIHCKSQGYITAQSRKSAQESTGYVFLRCVITSNGRSSYMHLGRPWAPFSRVVFAYTWMDACIKPEGWNNWNNPENEKSACFYEYRCSGPGSNPCKRVSWARQLMDDEAVQFITQSFIDPDEQKPWLMNNMSMKIPLSAYS